MKLKKFGFLWHHKKMKIEGVNLPGLINRCIKHNIVLKELEYKSPLESTVKLKEEDHERITKIAGHSYRLTLLGEGGLIPLFNMIKTNTVTIIGAFILGALIFYQGSFVAEIQIDGYETLTERQLRQTLAESGLYEGVKKPDDYTDVKAELYKKHENITWVSIYEDGRLIKVTVAESGKGKEPKTKENYPASIIASKSGMIEKIIPLQGNAKVKKGDYVNKGDVLISGKYKYQSSDYSKGDDYFIMYSHAEGQAFAKVPRKLEFYMEKTERIKEKTGRNIPGIYIMIGDLKIDTAKMFNTYKSSARQELILVDSVKPLPLKLSLIKVEEVKLLEQRRKREELDKMVRAAVRQYRREKLKKGEEILDETIEYSETENLIKAGVFLEVLEDIGEDRKINVKKEEKTEKDR